jgi:hypothetical protein
MMLTANLPDPSSPTKSGWARFEASGGSVSGVATFQFAEGNDLRTIAGVFAAPTVETVTIPVDNDEDQDRFTGFAVANPNDVAINIRLATVDTAGALRDQLQPQGLTPLAAHGQVAAYLHQYLSSTRKFRGSLKLMADGGSKFVVVALQQSKGLFTAIPVIPDR